MCSMVVLLLTLTDTERGWLRPGQNVYYNFSSIVADISVLELVFWQSSSMMFFTTNCSLTTALFSGCGNANWIMILHVQNKKWRCNLSDVTSLKETPIVGLQLYKICTLKFQIYLSKLQNIFLQLSKYICQNF